MAYSDDQAEIDSMMSSPMANMTGSVPATSELNANISGLRSSINALSQQVVSLSKSTASVASQFGKHVNREYGIDGKAMGQSIAGAIAGPLGVVFAKSLSESGVGERIGAGIKGSLGSLVSKLKGNRPNYQSGFLDPSSMSKISNQNTRLLTESIGNDINKPLIEANRIAQLELNETRKGNSDITSAVRNVSSTISDSSESYTESIVAALENLGSKFEDSQAKQSGNPFVDFAKSIFWTSKIGTLFRGKYTNDITRSKNPLETQVSALLQIYRWQRLYGELTKNQFNEVIRLLGGQEKDVVGKHGLLKDFWLRNKKSIKSKMGNGFQTKLIDFFMYDEEDRDDRNRAAMAAGLGQTLNGKRNKLFTWNSLNPLSSEDDRESALGYAKGLDTTLMSAQQLQRATDELSSRFDRYQKSGKYGEWVKPDIDYKSVKESNDRIRDEIQKLKDNPAKRSGLYNPLNWFTSKEDRILKNAKKRAELEGSLNTKHVIAEQIADLEKSKRGITDRDQLKSIDEKIKSLRDKSNTKSEESLRYKSQKFYGGVNPELYDSYGNLPKANGINISHTYNSSGSTFKPVSPNPLYNPSLEGIIPETVPVTVMGYAGSGDEKTSSNIVAKAKQMANMDLAKKDPESLKISMPVVNDPQTALLQTVAKSSVITAAAASKSAHYQEKIFEDDQEDESEEARNRRWQREWDKKQREKEKEGGKGGKEGGILSKLDGVARTLGSVGKFLAPIAGAVGGALAGYNLAKFLNPFQNDENVRDSTKNAFAMNGSVMGTNAGLKAGEYAQKGINKFLTKIPVGKYVKRIPGVGALGKFGRFLGKGLGTGLNVVNTGVHVADGYSRYKDNQSVRGINQMVGGAMNWVPGGGLAASMYGDLATEVGDSVQGKVGDLTAKATLNDGTVLQNNAANRIGDRATLVTQQVGTKALPTAVNMIAKGVQAIAKATGIKLATQAGAKLATVAGSKLFTKGLPGVGAALSVVDASSRLSEGDKAGAVTSLMAGAAVFIPPPGVGFVVSMGLSGVLIVHDIQRGIKQMKDAAAVEDAMRDARFFMDEEVAQKIQQISTSDLSDTQKLDTIAKLYNNWKKDKGRPDYAKEIALMAKNKLFLKDKNTNIAFKKIDELAKKAKLNKQTAFGFKIGYYDSWKKDQVKKIGIETVKHVVNDRALKDENFKNNNKEEIDVLAKALKNGKIDLISYYGDLYFMYYAYVRSGSKSHADKNFRDYYTQMLEFYDKNNKAASEVEIKSAAEGDNVKILSENAQNKETPIAEKATEVKKLTESKNTQETPIAEKANEASGYINTEYGKVKINPNALEHYGKEKLEKEPWHNYEDFTRVADGKLRPYNKSKAKHKWEFVKAAHDAEKYGNHTRIGNEPVLKDKPLTENQLGLMEMGLAAGATYEPWIMEKYKAQTKGNVKLVSDNSTAQNMEEVKKNQQLEATNKVYTQTKALEGTTKAVKDGTDRTVAAGNVNAAKISNSVNNVTNIINNNNTGSGDSDNPTLYQPNIASNVMNV